MYAAAAWGSGGRPSDRFGVSHRETDRELKRKGGRGEILKQLLLQSLLVTMLFLSPVLLA